ncbi:hypothetical protein HKD37_10G029985 [Glycine soja]
MRCNIVKTISLRSHTFQVNIDLNQEIIEIPYPYMGEIDDVVRSRSIYLKTLNQIFMKLKLRSPMADASGHMFV